MTAIDLHGRIPYFSDAAHLAALNDVVGLHTRLAPNVLMMSTGCSFKQAMRILWLLFELEFAEGFLLLYLRDDPDVFIDRRSLIEGLPDFPLQYNYGANSVESADDILYSFEFVRAVSVEFLDSHG